MQKKSFFKILFWVLSAAIGALLISILGLITMGKSIDPDFPTFMIFYFIIIFIFVAAILTALAVFVYRDALKRGMDPWMWMTIVVFVPNLIGLIIYLVVRKNNTNYEKICISCKKPVNNDFKLCPYCGCDLNIHCPECGREVSDEWGVCPYCSKILK